MSDEQCESFIFVSRMTSCCIKVSWVKISFQVLHILVDIRGPQWGSGRIWVQRIKFNMKIWIKQKDKENMNNKGPHLNKLRLSPATSSYINPLRVSALISSTKNDQQGAAQDAS